MSFWKIIIFCIAALLIFYGFLWFSSQRIYPIEYGISFSKQHAQSLGLDWQKVYLALLDELKPKYLRFSATWMEIEPQRGSFDWGDIDWQMAEAAKRDVEVTLVVGQKAPRWPECHVPGWALDLSESEYRRELVVYLQAVIERYQNHQALEIWQVENEPFIKFRFGECQRFEESLVKEEIEFVRFLDPEHKIMVTDSGELSTWRQASRVGDIFGTTVYRVVKTPLNIYWSYDWLPAAFYRWKANFWGLDVKNVFISELQAEPWFVDTNPTNTAIEEQEKSMDPERLTKHLKYASQIGTPRAYLWGVEWWYWMKENKGDKRYWEMVKEELKN